MKKYFVTAAKTEFALTVDTHGGIHLDGTPVDAETKLLDGGTVSVIAGGKSHRVTIHRDGGVYRVLLNGKSFPVRVESARERLLKQFAAATGGTEVKEPVSAPMPALVVKVHVKPGDTIEPGTRLLVLEAMKMENEIRSQQSGVVKEVHVSAGQPVEKGELLITLE